MKIASEQELIAKINRLQQVKGEHLKYEVSTEMRALPTEPSRANAERGRAISEQRVGCTALAARRSWGTGGGTEWPTTPEAHQGG